MNSVLPSIITGEDSFGNTYYLGKEGTVYLKPNDSNITRNIGKIGFKNDLIYYLKYEEESQRFRKTDAWSINWYVGKHVDLIYFKTRKDTYKITSKTALAHGDFYHFKSSTERKLYVPVKYWTKKSEVK